MSAMFDQWSAAQSQAPDQDAVLRDFFRHGVDPVPGPGEQPLTDQYVMPGVIAFRA